jgi:hypothetical protein
MIGQKSDSCPSTVITKQCRHTDRIPFGSLVVWAGDISCRLPTTKEDMELVAGIVLLDGAGDSYKPGSTVNILREGRVFIEAPADIDNPGAPVFIRFDKGPGTFDVKEDPATIKLKGACYLHSAKKGDAVELEVNFIGSSK